MHVADLKQRPMKSAKVILSKAKNLADLSDRFMLVKDSAAVGQMLQSTSA